MKFDQLKDNFSWTGIEQDILETCEVMLQNPGIDLSGGINDLSCRCYGQDKSKNTYVNPLSHGTEILKSCKCITHDWISLFFCIHKANKILKRRFIANCTASWSKLREKEHDSMATLHSRQGSSPASNSEIRLNSKSQDHGNPFLINHSKKQIIAIVGQNKSRIGMVCNEILFIQIR